MNPAYEESGFGIILILVVIALVGLSIAGGFYLFTHKGPLSVISQTDQTKPQPTAQASGGIDLQGVYMHLNQLETQVNELKSLEGRVGSLETQVKSLNSPRPAQGLAATTSKQSATYIPIGSTNDAVGTTNWSNFSQLLVIIDPSDFPGYTSMELIGQLRLNAGGTAHARLYNNTDGQEVTSSEIVTTNTIFTLLNSGQFTLPAGRKSYQIQGKSDTGDQIFVQNMKIKVNF